ncbi:endonuclease G [Allopseudospirillum japonicum]|uniref:Endonuclease G n=1 Tax=Allopseudospirillum japonicum TaxID=64971 RepID=A0A1H6RTK4_9GAMM|nr:DNA/RNA non-specific endonuclease [Allopseudospirillum japonicum]SEI54522.1 endonuclease G [Allopseudospirillum japonicum]
MQVQHPFRLMQGTSFKTWFKVTLVSVFAVLLSACSDSENAPFAGFPQAQGGWKTWHRVLHNEAFSVGYSDIRLNPLWVSYQLQPLEERRSMPRPSQFETDWRVPWLEHEDYTRSGYDRGHMAPNHAIAQLYGRKAQLETFWMTNISPQSPKLNRGIWRRLEEAALDHFAPLHRQIWVITGPIFGSGFHFLDTSWVQVPEAFYKIFIVPSQGKQPPHLLAFMIPQEVTGKEKLADFVVNIDTLETLTGLDFLTELPDTLEENLERQIDTRSWQIAKLK